MLKLCSRTADGTFRWSEMKTSQRLLFYELFELNLNTELNLKSYIESFFLYHLTIDSRQSGGSVL